jgi:protein-S-isoprenylcysteine O-methyltransferase Ste14
MGVAPGRQGQLGQHDPGFITRLGAWLFSHRTLLPLPIAAALLMLPPQASAGTLLRSLGILVVAGAELLRLWAVRQIGVISRTRSDRLGALVSGGPFALVRNPLYIGNIALWTGFALSAGLPSVAPIVVFALGLAYHAIVQWEEDLLEARLGDSYRRYARTVPRWLPRIRRASDAAAGGPPFPWKDTFFSERGTLLAIAAGFGLLWIKEAIR